MSKVTTSVRTAVFRPWHRPSIVFSLVYCPVDNTLFEVCCLGAAITTVAMAATQLVLNQFENFLTNQLRIE